MEDNNFLEKIMELGIGLSMARQMPDMFSGAMGKNNAGPQQPPQIPQEAVFYLVVNGSQAGPFNEAALQRIIQNKLISPETLVWKPGMASWQPASAVPEVNKLFILSQL